MHISIHSFYKLTAPSKLHIQSLAAAKECVHAASTQHQKIVNAVMHECLHAALKE